MNTVNKIIIVLLVIMGIGAGLVFWKSNVANKKSAGNASLTEEEIQLILADQRPLQLEGLKENKERRAGLLDTFKQSLAFAAAARAYGLDKDPDIKAEMKNQAKEVLAASYDYKMNVNKGPAPPLGYVTEEQIKQFWESGSWFERFFNSKESNFQSFVNTKINLAKRNGRLPENAEPKKEELEAARDRYSRTQITYELAKAKLKEVKATGDQKTKDEWNRFERKVAVQTKMQHNDLLARIYAREVLAKKVAVTEEEVSAYLKKNPQLENKAEKKKKAQDVLKEVLDDGNFEELAKEHSDDPGSKNRGGLYEGVTEGRFAPQFEAAVAKLKPGEISKDVVETDFGFHIIKLVKRGMAKGNDGKAKNTYDVQHILIGTMITDPDNPQKQPVSAAIYARTKLETEKQKKIIDGILKDNKVSVPEDFKVPAPSRLAEEREAAIKKAQADQEKRMKEAAENAKKSGAPAAPGAAPNGARPGQPPTMPNPQAPNGPRPAAPRTAPPSGNK